MFAYGKTASNGIAAMSYLAERYDGARVKSSSVAISKDREISKPLIAKILTILSQAGLVDGSPGPGGGYYLARHPRDITLYNIVRLFEKIDDQINCPFGTNWCGNQDPCPMHEQLLEMDARIKEFLNSTTLDVFLKSPKPVLKN